MKTFVRNARPMLPALAAALVLGAIVIVPSIAHAQLPDADGAYTALSSTLGPYVSRGLKLLGVMAFFGAVWEGFKGVRGMDPMGGFKALGLLFIGAIMFAPLTVFGPFMSANMQQAVRLWLNN